MQGVEEKPLLVLDRIGKGRVAQFNSDHIWLWARGFEGGGPQAELLRRLAHWLMKEPELEEDELRMTFDGDRLLIERRRLEQPPSAGSRTSDAGWVKSTIKLVPGRVDVRPRQCWFRGRASVRVRDASLTAHAAAGALNPKEIADLRSTDRLVRPLVEATGGGIKWINQGAFDIRRVRPGRSVAGEDWLGLGGTKVISCAVYGGILALPPLIALLVSIGLIVFTWRREGE